MGRDFFSRMGGVGPRELPRGPDERPGTGEYGTPRDLYGYEYGSEGAGRNARINSLMDEMAKQLQESESVLAKYEGGLSPEQVYGIESVGGGAGIGEESPVGAGGGVGVGSWVPPSLETIGGGEPLSPGGAEDRPGAFQFGEPSPPAGYGGPEDRGRPGAFQFGEKPRRLQRPVTRGGKAVREPAGAGGNTALRFQEPPTGFSLLRGEGSGGSAGGSTLEGFGPDEFENFRRRVLGVRR